RSAASPRRRARGRHAGWRDVLRPSGRRSWASRHYPAIRREHPMDGVRKRRTAAVTHVKPVRHRVAAWIWNPARRHRTEAVMAYTDETLEPDAAARGSVVLLHPRDTRPHAPAYQELLDVLTRSAVAALSGAGYDVSLFATAGRTVDEALAAARAA